MALYNGANDVSKGVATLHGSGLCGYRGALAWGTVWTVAGGLTAVFIASGLLKVFSKGIVADGMNLGVNFSMAVAVGVSVWVLLSTRTGMPVSTTHSVVGAVLGPVLLSFGPSMILWQSLGYKIVIPLLLSPFAALLITSVFYRAGYGLLSRFSRYCLCFETKTSDCCVAAGEGQLAASRGDATLSAVAGTVKGCEQDLAASVRMDVNDIAHWVSSALISFARALNDTPKIVAVLFASAAFTGGDLKYVFLLVALSMGLGSYLMGRRVTETLSKKITAMDRHDSVIANLSTAFLVVFASRLGMPVSTTHVSGGSIIGVGLKRGDGSFNRNIVSGMLLAWFVTLPAAGIISAIAYVALNHIV